jgi:hypothetical protein
MPHKRSQKKLEERIAKQYVYKHSVLAHRNNNPDEITERIYKGTSDNIIGHVLSTLGKMELEQKITLTREPIPDYPQGLVFTDSRGEGFFDVNLS